MITGVVYTETYKITLTAVIDSLEGGYGAARAERLLNRIDRIVDKIIKSIPVSGYPDRLAI